MSIVRWWCLTKARSKQDRLKAFLDNPGRILDVGCGNGALVHLLRSEGRQIEAMDVLNKSKFVEVQPLVYNGKNFPFEHQEFDTVLLITMLHHTTSPEHILKEAMRVGKELIVMEDVYRNAVQKRLTFFVDSLVNREFKGHPHTNKTDQGWKDFFAAQGWELKAYRKDRFLLFFTQTIYHLRLGPPSIPRD